MNDEELTGFYDVYGHLPKSYNRRFVVKERLDFSGRFKLIKTLGKGVGEHSTKVKKRMMKMTLIMYALSFAGVFLQATEILPGISDRVTFSAIVGGLVAANLLQWNQSIKERDQNRKTLEKIVNDHQGEIQRIQDTMMNIFRELKK